MNNKVRFSFLLCFSACFGICKITINKPLNEADSLIELPDANTPEDFFKQVFPDAGRINEPYLNYVYLNDQNNRLSRTDFSLPDGSSVQVDADPKYTHSLCISGFSESLPGVYDNGPLILLGDFAELALPKEAPILPILLKQNPENLPYISQLVELTKAVILKMPNGGDTLEISKETPFSCVDFHNILLLNRSCENRGTIENIMHSYGLQIRVVQECVPGLE